MERVLVTGITGFVGSHLADFLLNEGHEVYGMVRWRSRTENIEHIKDKLTLIESDLKDVHSLKSLIDETEPEMVFHLAAQSFVPASWKSPSETLDINVVGTVNLFEAIRSSKFDPRIHIAGSSEEYGLVKADEVPILETNQLRPLSPYGVSKVATDLLGYQYNRSYGMKIVRTRGFNHTGPRRGEVFVCSDFAKQIVEIEKGKRQPELNVGNLSAKRDFTDVRDMVKAYHLALKKCDFGEVYNVCSENAIDIQKVLDVLLSLSKSKVEVKNDPARMRPSDVEILLGSCEKFREKTGWKAEIPFEKTMQDLLDYWRERV